MRVCYKNWNMDYESMLQELEHGLWEYAGSSEYSTIATMELGYN